MRTRKFAAYCLVVLLGGCVPIPIFSLHPLYTKETITFREKLLGTWLMDPNEPEDTLEFARLEESTASRLPFDLQDQAAKCYRVNLNGKASVVACLVKLQDRLFLDIMPGKSPGGEQDPESTDFQVNATFFLRLHMFVRVNFSGDQLKIGLTLDDGFKKLLQAEPKAVTYTMIKETPILIKGDDTVKEHPLLTASTQELQAFVTKYADDERLFIDGKSLTRKPSNITK